jgi:hypothetical protein
MNTNDPDTLYKDDDVMVTRSCILFKGERISINKIKKAYVAPVKIFMCNPTYMGFYLEVGLFRRKLSIFSELARPSIWEAANLLAGPDVIRWKVSSSDFKYIASRCGPNDSCSIDELKADPKVPDRALREVEGVLANWVKLISLESAVHRAMASSS